MYKKVSGNDAWFNFSEILEIESRYNAKSTFFFLPRNKTMFGIKNADYRIKDRKFKTVFDTIRHKGSEVGLHGSVGSNRDTELLKEDIIRTGSDIRGNRFHFLLYDPKVTPGILENSGLLYDSSLGFAEAYGFRNSFCMPFKP